MKVRQHAMKIELHLHTSRYSPCAIDNPDTLMRRLIRDGYQVVYITEHERMWSHTEIRVLQQAYPQLKIFPGVELSMGAVGGTHLLVLGTTDQEYVWLQSEPEAVIQKAQTEGHLTVLAHPFRWPEGFEMLQAGVLPDALEYLTNNHSGPAAGESRRAAETFGLKLVNSGDIHAAMSLDRFWIESEFPLETAGDIRPIILGGLYTLFPDLDSADAEAGDEAAP